MSEENVKSDSGLVPVSPENKALSIQKSEPNALTSLLHIDQVKNIIIHKNCKTCKSPFRADAEKMFDEGKSLSKIKEFLDSNQSTGGSMVAIRHHMINHHRALEHQIALTEICEHIQEMAKIRSDRQNELETLKNVGFHELSKCLTIMTNGDISKEKIKNDVVVKTMRVVLDIEKQLGEMHSADMRVAALQQQFIKIWRDKIVGAKSKEEKDMYIETLKDFKKIVDTNISDGG